MTTQQQRTIHRLLLQREREFTAVWRAECEVNKIVGAPFPFAEPPDLPSSYKPVKAKATNSGKPKIPKISTLIRTLQGDENAYKVIYFAEGKKYESFQTDTALLRKLVPLKTASFYLSLVVTVKLHTLTDYVEVQTLWQQGVEYVE